MMTLSRLTALLLFSAPVAAQTIDNVQIASGLNSPIYIGSPSGDYDRVFIGEQTGNIRILRNGSLLPTPFLTQSVLNGSERGLLGVAFHPQFATNGFVFVDFTRNSDGATMVVRYRVSTTNPDVVDPSTATTMIGPISQPYSNHNAGCIQFGPDGFLYVALGDGGSGGDPSCNAQNGQSLLGKLLRLDVDQNPGGPAVAAAGNPFIGNPAYRDEIFHYGLRNPWRFSFDRLTGDLWIGDVGQNTLEEVDFAPAGVGGLNFGWKIKEGTNCFSSSACVNPLPCTSTSLTNPVYTMPTSSNCSVIGGIRYGGCAIPGLTGTYIFGDYCSGRIYSFEFTGGQMVNFRDRTAAIGGGGSLRSFGEDASGEILYVAGGSAYRIVPLGAMNSQIAGPGSTGSHGVVPIYEPCGLFGPGNRVTFRLRDGVPNAPSTAIFALSSSPLPLNFPGFGTVYAWPVTFSIPLMSNGQGLASFEMPGSGFPPVRLFHQIAQLDVGISGVTLSNALDTVFFAGPPPSITSVSPLSAAVGVAITINGSNFDPAVTLDVGGLPVTPTSVTPTAIQFSYPAGLPCDSTLVVTNPGAQFVSAGINPTPTVTSTFNGSGPAAGGTQFIMIGTGFAPGTTVDIGGNPAVVTTASASGIVCTTPPGTPGVAQVSIQTPGGCQTTSSFTYL